MLGYIITNKELKIASYQIKLDDTIHNNDDPLLNIIFVTKISDIVNITSLQDARVFLIETKNFKKYGKYYTTRKFKIIQELSSNELLHQLTEIGDVDIFYNNYSDEELVKKLYELKPTFKNYQRIYRIVQKMKTIDALLDYHLSNKKQLPYYVNTALISRKVTNQEIEKFTRAMFQKLVQPNALLIAKHTNLEWLTKTFIKPENYKNHYTNIRHAIIDQLNEQDNLLEQFQYDPQPAIRMKAATKFKDITRAIAIFKKDPHQGVIASLMNVMTNQQIKETFLPTEDEELQRLAITHLNDDDEYVYQTLGLSSNTKDKLAAVKKITNHSILIRFITDTDIPKNSDIESILMDKLNLWGLLE